MKTMRKTLALLIVVVMIAAMLPGALAATVTVPSDGILQNHTFTAYQIFAGDEANGVLSNIVWGSGVDGTALLTALKADTTHGNLFSACTEADDVATVLSSSASDTTLVNWFIKQANTNKTATGTTLNAGANTLDTGYYLFVDTSTTVDSGSAYNASLLQVVGNITIKAKTDAPTVEKKVREDDQYNKNDGYGSGYNDVADYSMGESVPFHLIGLVPDMTQFDTYKYIFHDTLSAGLTPPADSSIKVYLSNDKAVGDDTDVTGSFSCTINGQNITVSCENLKSIQNIAKGMYIIVKYTAVLNENAVIGLNGNPNTVKLEYSNKPDQSGSGDTNNTGYTPEDKVIVFTYQLNTTKIDGATAESENGPTKLKDAKFVLLNSDASKVAKISNGKFANWQDLPTAGTDGKISVESWPSDSVLISAETTGLFSVAGLDDGTYKLREIVAPQGYNLLSEDVVVVIDANTANGQAWNGTASDALTGLNVTAGGKAGTGDTSGIASITIANNSGATLPTTGGMGTTLFYVLGSVLVIGAVVLLVSKKRMNAAE